MGFRGLIFDLDGTLLNTLTDIACAANNVLGRLGFPQHKIETYRYFIGSGVRTLSLRALPENSRDETLVNNISLEIEEEYSRIWSNNTLPYDGIPELLDALTGLNIKMAILTNKPHEPAEKMVLKILSPWRFERIIGAQPSIIPKPDPTAALQITRQMNLEPADCFYLGDSTVDMQTAVAAKMYPVGALWGFSTAEELAGGGARTLIKHPAELLDILDDNRKS